MSIRVVPQNEVSKNAAETIPPLLFPNLKNLYSRRAERLRQLAEGHPLADYLNFAAAIAQAQQQALKDHPLSFNPEEVLGKTGENAPLDATCFPRAEHWRSLLNAIITELMTTAPDHVLPVLENLQKVGEQELESLATSLFAGEYAQVGSDKAPFLWAALSLYWAQMASSIPGKGRSEYGEQRQFCPVCGSMPVGSIVHIGTINGLRYLHCSLCESEWHVVRIKCSNCEQTEHLDYWSLDTEQAAIKAESCGDCGSYLKVFYQDKDPHLEVVADDLASLVLDARMEEEGFARSSINPFLFPSDV